MRRGKWSFPNCSCSYSLGSLRPGSCPAPAWSSPQGALGGEAGAGGAIFWRSPWGEESAESALRAPATSAPVPLFIPVRRSPSSSLTQAQSPETPSPTPPTSPLSWKLLSKKVVKMIKCEQIFSSFSTLIKNGFSVQRKLETEEQLPEGPQAEKVRENHSEMSEHWPAVARGHSPTLRRSCHVPTGPAHRGQQGPGVLLAQRQCRDGGRGLSKQVCSLDRVGMGWKAEGVPFPQILIVGEPPVSGRNRSPPSRRSGV